MMEKFTGKSIHLYFLAHASYITNLETRRNSMKKYVNMWRIPIVLGKLDALGNHVNKVEIAMPYCGQEK